MGERRIIKEIRGKEQHTYHVLPSPLSFCSRTRALGGLTCVLHPSRDERSKLKEVGG
jgi:hypothetical protein